MRFDGKKFAREIEAQVREKVGELGRAPKVLSVMVGNDSASELYTRLKKEAAERVGITFEVQKFADGEDVAGVIKDLAASYDGVMIQMPIPGMNREEQIEVARTIPLLKDVDGLRWEKSGVMPATVKAVLLILAEINKQTPTWGKEIVVVGDRGSVGKPLVSYLIKRGERVVGVNTSTKNAGGVMRRAEVLVSCAGQAGLVTEKEVGEGAVLVDVGISKTGAKVVGDMTQAAYDKAVVAVPVPGGVGPVTVASLMANVVECAS